jgi:transposase-like protein
MTAKGKQKYLCKNCGAYRTLGTTQFYDDSRKEEILKSYKERSSLRGVQRTYGVAVTTVLRWLKKKSRV